MTTIKTRFKEKGTHRTDTGYDIVMIGSGSGMLVSTKKPLQNEGGGHFERIARTFSNLA